MCQGHCHSRSPRGEGRDTGEPPAKTGHPQGWHVGTGKTSSAPWGQTHRRRSEMQRCGRWERDRGFGGRIRNDHKRFVGLCLTLKRFGLVFRPTSPICLVVGGPGDSGSVRTGLCGFGKWDDAEQSKQRTSERISRTNGGTALFAHPCNASAMEPRSSCEDCLLWGTHRTRRPTSKQHNQLVWVSVVGNVMEKCCVHALQPGSRQFLCLLAFFLWFWVLPPIQPAMVFCLQIFVSKI